MSQSQKGLIKQIKTLQTFCLENGLRINYDKTKIMIENTQTKYNRLKIISRDSNYDIEVVDSYKYLGMLINTQNINNRSHVEYLANKGKQSSFMTSKILKEFGQVNGNFLRDTFDMMSLSKMKYCGELCFRDNLTLLNQVQYQFYKRFCHLKVTTPNYCLIGEFGIKPIEFHFYKAALNYWLKILITDERSAIKRVYDHIKINIEEKCHINTWCWQIKKLLHELKLEQLWLNQDNIDRNNYKVHKWTVKTRLIDYFREQWINSARNSHRGLDYLELSRFNCEIKPYLNWITCDRSIIQMLKLRIGNHVLSVETDRYKNRKLYNERLCNLCNTHKVQDLYHVFVECPKFIDTRLKDLNNLTRLNKSEFYSYLDKVNRKDLILVTKFMEKIEETIKNQNNN